MELDNRYQNIVKQINWDVAHIVLAFDKPIDQTHIDILENVIKMYYKCLSDDIFVLDKLERIKLNIDRYVNRLNSISNRQEFVNYSNYINDLLDNYLDLCIDYELYESCTNLRNIRNII